MTLQMLYVHWKAVRIGLVPFVLAAFGLPLMVAQQMSAWREEAPTMVSLDVLSSTDLWAPFFPALAAAVGCLLALSAWNWDHKTHHVYALSLPVSRQRYAMTKFSAGLVLALIPMSALLLGGTVASLVVDTPAEIRAYPVQVAGHFLLASVLVYAILFALASGTIRTTVVLLSVFVGIPVLFSLGLFEPVIGDVPVAHWVEQAMRYGPLRILFGRWMLFDV